MKKHLYVNLKTVKENDNQFIFDDSLHMLLQGTTMLLQSGYISTIGIKKMYKAGKFDETSMTGYVLSQYVPFRDKKVLMELMKREINVQ